VCERERMREENREGEDMERRGDSEIFLSILLLTEATQNIFCLALHD
jgi:hypothetical protein